MGKLEYLSREAHEAAELTNRIRDSINLTNVLTAPKDQSSPYYEKTALEQMLEDLSEMPRKIFATREKILQQINPNMGLLNSQLEAFNKALDQTRVQVEVLQKKYPISTPKDHLQDPSASSTWMGKLITRSSVQSGLQYNLHFDTTQRYSDDGSKWTLQITRCQTDAGGHCATSTYNGTYKALEFTNNYYGSPVGQEDDGSWGLGLKANDTQIGASHEFNLYFADKESADEARQYLQAMNSKAWGVE
jgi:hypothetical protein